MRIVPRLVFVGVLSLVTSLSLASVSADRWTASTGREFLLGTFEGTSIDREGRIALAPRLTHLWGPEAGIVWDIVAAPRGGVFVALSGPGQILFIDDDGEAESWYQADGESLITAIASDGRGGVYAGLTPEGRVLHIKRPGEVAAIVETEATFLWDLARDERGRLWIATGVPGSVQLLDGPGGLETVHETGDDPVRTLVTGGGEVLAGTGGRGRVIRVAGSDAPYVLYDAPEAEIVALVRDDDGTVWALAAAGGKQPTAKPPATQGGVTHVRVTAQAPKQPDNGKGKPNGTPSKKKDADKERPNQSFRGNAGGTLYRISPEGADPIWKTTQGIPFDLTRAPDGFLLVATGDDGRVWRVSPDGEQASLIPIASNQASALARSSRGDVFIAGTSDARIEKLVSRPRVSGEYLSLPIDAGIEAAWGRIHWEALLPEGAAVSASVRVGNTTEPDETWSDWTPLPADGRVDREALPASRLLQVRLELRATGQAGPQVSALRVSYDPRNRSPEIASLSVESPGVVIVPGPTQSGARMGPLVADDPVTRGAGARTTRGNARQPIRRGWEAGARTFTWSASDPDQDRLTFRLDLRREGDLYWFPLAAGLKGKYYSWDARATPDGRYRVRLTVSDETDNPNGDARSHQETSELFVVDNSRPALTGWSVEGKGERREVAFTAVDPGGVVAAVEVAMDAGEWHLLDPEDGVADSEEERYRLTLPAHGNESLPESVRVRVTDAAGNLGGEMKRVERP